MAKDQQHEEISHGFIYALLTEPPTDALKTYRDVTLLTRDGLHAVTQNLSMLVADKYPKLSDMAKKQLLWLTKELIKNGVANVDSIMWCLLRQAAGGDVSQANMFLVEAILDICTEYRVWLEKLPMLVAAVVYTFVRLIEDHSSPMLSPLRAKEVKFVVQLIRDHFGDVIPLGRDFIRILQNVARIPEFESLWKDMLNNPKTLYPTFTGVWQILKIRTSRRFLQLRLTPEIERKILFMTNNVKFGNHKRYQDWFQARYFTTMESHSLRSDLIRFIVNAIHPSNDMLSSDLIPRWAIIGWLLTSSTNITATANSKLALFYDWLFFDAAKDSIMNIEPGILVMYHSIRNHPLVSSTLLDFLCRIVKNFFPKYEDKVRAGVYNSLRNILEKQVSDNRSRLLFCVFADFSNTHLTDLILSFFALSTFAAGHLQPISVVRVATAGLGVATNDPRELPRVLHGGSNAVAGERKGIRLHRRQVDNAEHHDTPTVRDGHRWHSDGCQCQFRWRNDARWIWQ